MYPIKLEISNKVELKLGIKSSLPKVKQTLALLYLLWKANGQLSTYDYAAQTNDEKIRIKDEYLEGIRLYLVLFNFADWNEDTLSTQITNNPLISSQLEALQVALELVWKISKINFSDHRAASSERQGRGRYPKELCYTKNIDIIDILVSTNEEEYIHILYNWLTDTNNPTPNPYETRLVKLLTSLSEEAIYKIRLAETEDNIFKLSGVYHQLANTQTTVNITDPQSNQGSLRILHRLLTENLNSYLKKLNGEVSVRDGINIEELKAYAERTDSYFSLTNINLEEIPQSAPAELEEPMDTENISPQIIFYGPPGTGKSYKVTELVKSIYPTYNENGDNNPYVFRTTIHSEYSYQDFIGNIMPVVTKGSEEPQSQTSISYEFIPGIFTQSLIMALTNSRKKIFLILEEMSRGNIVSIFGDIFQLLDRDYDGACEYTIKNDLITSAGIKYCKDEGISDEFFLGKDVTLPSNFHIIGTVNTSDQNVFVMDNAFKRRFEFEYINIDPILDTSDYPLNEYEFTLENGRYSILWSDFYQEINKFILDKLDMPEDKQIGQFFIKFKPILPTDSADIKNKKDSYNYKQLCNKLLQYLWTDVQLANMSEHSLIKTNIRSFGSAYAQLKDRNNIFDESLMAKYLNLVEENPASEEPPINHLNMESD